MKVYPVTWYSIWCEGCKQPHSIAHTWQFNGSTEMPTFTPSVKITYGKNVDPEFNPGPYCCHFNITNGQIIYHSDRTHELKGQTLPLKDYPKEYMS